MFSFFAPKNCKRCSGELSEVEKQLIDLKAENQRLRQSLALANSQKSFTEVTPKVVYIASWSRSHFHRPSCVWMEKLSKDKIREFSSHEEAVKAGYRPCKTCCA